MKPGTSPGWGLRLLGGGVRLMAFNPCDGQRRKVPVMLAEAQPKRPELVRGLLLNRDGAVFGEDGRRVGSIDLGANAREVVWRRLEELEDRIVSVADQRLFLDFDRTVMSVDTMRASFPAVLRGDFLKGIDDSGYDQYASWLKQLENVRP